MNKIACQYAIVRFSPFIETGEFANIGIIMIAPKHNYFGFQLATKRFGRITRFFDDIDASVYRKTINNFKVEMKRIADTLNSHSFHNHANSSSENFFNDIFNEITRSRETIIRFSDIRTVLANNPQGKLTELFEYYVERNFVTKEYKETILEKGLRKLLLEANIGKQYTRKIIGDDAYHVSFPFVAHKKGNHNDRIIKPLHLGHDESTKIYEHGDSWVSKIQRLKEKRYLQTKNVLFTLSGPEFDTGIRFEVYSEIEKKLLDTGVQVISFENNREKIINFATAH